MKTLNLGSGESTYGTHRFDVIKRPQATHVGNIEDPLPFPDEFFEEVYARQIFEHLPNPLNVLLEMKRVCKQGGKIKIITDNGGFVLFHHNRIGVLHGDYRYEGDKIDKKDMHYMFFQPEHLRNFFWKADIEPVSITLERMDNDDKKFLPWFSKLKRYIISLLGKRMGRHKIIAIGKKKIYKGEK